MVSTHARATMPAICDTDNAPRFLPAASRMRLFTPGQSKRLNEVTGFVFLAGGILFLLSMASFHPQDPSWDTVAGLVRTSNLVGPVGAHVSDVFLQSFGL